MTVELGTCRGVLLPATVCLKPWVIGGVDAVLIDVTAEANGVNGHVKVPAGGQVEVPGPSRLFRWLSGGFLLSTPREN